jgi:hypothetical protein
MWITNQDKMEKTMKLVKPALLATAALISLLSILSVTSHAVQNAANFTGDITLKQDAAGANTGIHFSNNTYQNSASPWSYSGLDIYFNSVGAVVSIGGLPAGAAAFQVFNSTNSGQAALFQVNNSGNPLPAVYGSTTGSGQAVFGLNMGTGRAGHFQIFNSGSTASALVAETNGTGYAGEFLGNLKVSGSITFADASTLTTAKTDCMGGRYEDNGDGTVSDCRTGLIWLKDANCLDASGGISKSKGILTWDNAILWTKGLGNQGGNIICGLTDGSTVGDWRLPTRTEWMAMVESARKQGFTNPILTNRAGTGKWTAGDPFDNVNLFYWSSSNYGSDITYAWTVSMNGNYNGFIKTSTAYVWPVRAGQ